MSHHGSELKRKNVWLTRDTIDQLMEYKNWGETLSVCINRIIDEHLNKCLKIGGKKYSTKN